MLAAPDRYGIAVVTTFVFRIEQARGMPVVFAVPRSAHDSALFSRRHYRAQVWR